jgi:AcrR family transcriptional regulator
MDTMTYLDSLGSAAGMVVTPWGNSDSLRERTLRRGPGIPREEVDRNQRERIFTAMVAVVAAKGYGATTVSEVTELAGVSTRTYYDRYPDKHAGFVATLQGMLEAAVAYAAALNPPAEDGSGGQTGGDEPKESEESWEARAREGFGALAEIVVAQPAAARLALIEAFAAGPDAMEPIEGAMAGFEWLARQTLEASPERAGMPDEMIRAHVGAMREICASRLRAGQERELPALLGPLWDLIRSYRPPPVPLRAARAARKVEESLEAHDHAERAIRAFAVVVAEKGYGAATVDDAISRGHMSASTLYSNFSGKEELTMAAIDTAGAQMGAAVIPAFRRAEDWAHGVRAGVEAMFSFLASRPALARLILVEIYAAGPEAVERRVEATAPMRELLAEGFERRPGTPDIAAEVISGGIYWLAYRMVREQGPAGLPTLAPICTYIALAPFIGAEEAARVVNGDGRG